MTPSRSEWHGLGMLRLSRLTQALLLLGACSLSFAQSEEGSGERRGFSIKPSLTVSGTATDNIGLDSGPKDRALIGMVSPGLVVRSTSGVLRGSLDYAMDGLVYYRTSQADRVLHRLQSQVNAALLEGRFLVDVRASVGQQARSAFGAEQSVTPYLSNSNQAQTATLSVTPRLRGTLAGLAAYDFSATGSETRVKDSLLGDGRSGQVTGNLEGLGGAQRMLNWTLSGSVMRAGGNPLTRTAATDSALAGLRYRPNPDVGLSVQAGKERSNLTTTELYTSNTYGLTLDWTPTERTQLNADWRRHHYGNSHALSFTHRMARSSWRYSDSQAVNGPGVVGATERQTNYALYDSIFSGIEPDPIQRDLKVRAYLLTMGLSADALANSGFLSGAATLTRSQLGAFSLLGLRSTATLTLSQAKTRRLDPFADLVPDDLRNGGMVRQRSAAFSLSHRLTPATSVGLTVSEQRSDGTTSNQLTDLKTLLANWNGQVSQRLMYSFSLRHSKFYSDLRAYRESAGTVTLTQQF